MGVLQRRADAHLVRAGRLRPVAMGADEHGQFALAPTELPRPRPARPPTSPGGRALDLPPAVVVAESVEWLDGPGSSSAGPTARPGPDAVPPDRRGDHWGNQGRSHVPMIRLSDFEARVPLGGSTRGGGPTAPPTARPARPTAQTPPPDCRPLLP